jgi:sugar (pentulose or hexulose) kinase
MAGVDSEKLPNLIGIEDEVGTMMPSIAADLGLPSGVVV